MNSYSFTATGAIGESVPDLLIQTPVILDFAFDKPCVMTSLFANGSNTRRSIAGIWDRHQLG